MCVPVHKELLDKAQILHRDISINNVMINTLANAEVQATQSFTPRHSYGTRQKKQPASTPLPIHKGLLIDFDYATFYKAGTRRNINKGHRTVCENSSNPSNLFTCFTLSRELFLLWLGRSFATVLKLRICRPTTSSSCSMSSCGFAPLIADPTMRSEMMQTQTHAYHVVGQHSPGP